MVRTHKIGSKFQLLKAALMTACMAASVGAVANDRPANNGGPGPFVMGMLNSNPTSVAEFNEVVTELCSNLADDVQEMMDTGTIRDRRAMTYRVAAEVEIRNDGEYKQCHYTERFQIDRELAVNHLAAKHNYPRNVAERIFTGPSFQRSFVHATREMVSTLEPFVERAHKDVDGTHRSPFKYTLVMFGENLEQDLVISYE